MDSDQICLAVNLVGSEELLKSLCENANLYLWKKSPHQSLGISLNQGLKILILSGEIFTPLALYQVP